jgi:hypothetical protein
MTGREVRALLRAFNPWTRPKGSDGVTSEMIARLRKLHARTSPGEWRADTAEPFDCMIWIDRRDGREEMPGLSLGQPVAPVTTWDEVMALQEDRQAQLVAEGEKADCEFCAAVHKHLPGLLDDLEAARAEARKRRGA